MSITLRLYREKAGFPFKYERVRTEFRQLKKVKTIGIDNL